MMDRCCFRFALAWLVVLALAPSTGSAQQQDPTEVPAPQLQVGDEWNYEIVDLWQGGQLARRRARVASLQGDRAVVALETQRANEWRRRDRSMTVDMRTLTEIKPAQPTFFQFDFPLKPGKSWHFEYPNDAPKRATNTVERWGHVTGWESVTVPAGTFRALRIEIKERRLWQAGDGVFPDHQFHTFWYAPEVKTFVRFEMEHRDAANKRTRYEGTLLKDFAVRQP
jgi:hypothetical protein